MAEENKSNSTEKLNSDESEMELQTEAQKIVLCDTSLSHLSHLSHISSLS